MLKAIPLLVATLAIYGCGGENAAITQQPTLTDQTKVPDETETTPEPDGLTVQPPQNFNILTDDDTTSRFLARSSFGASTADLQQWRGQDAALWVQEQLQMPPIQIFDDTESQLNTNGNNANTVIRNYMSYRFHRTLYEGDEQLRTRMAFALSQLLVVGGEIVQSPHAARRGAGWHDLLQEHAFGNYRDLLQAITYSPAMAEWLTFIRNNRLDPETGAEPDENYARELMQLFTIGLHELNLDGSQKLDSNGERIPTYNNDDVANLARVFTGLTHAEQPYYRYAFVDAIHHGHLPMQIFEEHHSLREKAFLGIVIPAGTSGADSIDIALDTIFSHPNVAPFVARQLIQRFTASNPAPEYVERVARAFESGRYISTSDIQFGDGRRGSLPATLAAILLDQTLFTDPDQFSPTDGKVREPLLGIAHWMRAFNAKNLEWLTVDRFLNNPEAVGSLQMSYMESPSVFNFYRPGFVPPNTQAGELGMTVPEFQLADATSFAGFVNAISTLVMEQPDRNFCVTTPGGFTHPGIEPCASVIDTQPFEPDYSVEIGMASNAPRLVDHLNTLLVGGRLEPAIREDIIDTLQLIAVGSTADEELRLQRVRLAVLMIVTSPAFSVIY